MTKKNEEEKQKKQPPVKEEDATESDVPEAEKLAALAEDYKRKWYSVSAEYDNYRKRNAAAVSKAYADGAAEAILKLLLKGKESF